MGGFLDYVEERILHHDFSYIQEFFVEQQPFMV